MPETPTADANAEDGAGKPTEPVSDAQATRAGATHSSADGQAAPRQPNEHDESSDSGTRPHDPKIAQAAKDVESGKQPTDRGETTDKVYQQHLRGSAGNGD